MSKSRDPRIIALKKQLAADISMALGPTAPYGTAQQYGVSQPRMSELMLGNVDRCTVDWLLRFAFRIGGSANLHLSIPPYRHCWNPRRNAIH